MGEAIDVEKPSVEHAEGSGWMCRKLDVGTGSKGWLDQLFLGPNNSHFIVEFKSRSGGKLSPKQRGRIRTLQDMGHTVYVCDSFKDFKLIFGVEHHKATLPPC